MALVVQHGRISTARNEVVPCSEQTLDFVLSGVLDPLREDVERRLVATSHSIDASSGCQQRIKVLRAAKLALALAWGPLSKAALESTTLTDTAYPGDDCRLRQLIIQLSAAAGCQHPHDLRICCHPQRLVQCTRCRGDAARGDVGGNSLRIPRGGRGHEHRLVVPWLPTADIG